MIPSTDRPTLEVEFFYEVLRPALGLSSYDAHNAWRYHAKLTEIENPVQQLAFIRAIDNIYVGLLQPLAEYMEYETFDALKEDIEGTVFSGRELHCAIAEVMEAEYGKYEGPLNRKRDGKSIYSAHFDRERDLGVVLYPEEQLPSHYDRLYDIPLS